jgi:Tol biopolymer transport system component
VSTSGGEHRITHTASAEIDPGWAPDGRTLVLQGTERGIERVFSISATGGGRKRLTNDSAGSGEPSVSCRGEIAFSTARSGDIEIDVMRANGTHARNLTRHSGHDGVPAWSPDGRAIAFASKRDGNEEIYMMDPDGTNERRLTHNAAADDDPTYSPDGRKILFTSKRSGRYQIWIMNRDGTEQRRFTSAPRLETQASWQPLPRR